MSQARLEARRYIRRSALVSRDLGAETLVVPIRGGVGDLNAIFSMNAVASDLWKLLAGEAGISGREMTEWITDHYDVDRTVAERDVLGFLSELCEAGLVEQTAGETRS
jgi:hypothetical protein